MPKPKVCVLGAFVADLTCRTERMPKWGETILGEAFKMGPGGKGSNQAVAAARLNADVHLITKVHGGGSYCSALDFDLSVVSEPYGIPVACIVSKMTALTPDEAAALPKDLRP